MTEFDARTAAVATVAGDPTLRDELGFGDRLWQFGRMEGNPTKPFMVFKFAQEQAVRNWREGPTQLPVQVWVHDRPGDYERIDKAIKRLRALYAALPNRPGFLESRYISTSIDLEDPELGTILKVASFQWTLA